MTLRWTKEAPTVAGNYLFRRDHSMAIPIRIAIGDGFVLSQTHEGPWTLVDGQFSHKAEWAGPIAPPEEARDGGA